MLRYQSRYINSEYRKILVARVTQAINTRSGPCQNTAIQVTNHQTTSSRLQCVATRPCERQEGLCVQIKEKPQSLTTRFAITSLEPLEISQLSPQRLCACHVRCLVRIINKTEIGTWLQRCCCLRDQEQKIESPTQIQRRSTKPNLATTRTLKVHGPLLAQVLEPTIEVRDLRGDTI